MKRALTLVLALSVLSAAPAAARAGQDPPPQNPPAAEVTPDQKAAAYIKETRAAQARHNEVEAKAAIAELVKIQKDEKVTPETKKGVEELLVKYAGEKITAVAVAAVDAFAELPPEPGAKNAMEAVSRALKAKEPVQDVVTAGFRVVKKHADPGKAVVGELVDLLKHKDDAIVAKAIDAMSGYKAAPGKVRRDMFEELLKQTEGVFNNSTKADDANAKRKWNIIGSAVNSALSALSGQNLADPAAARKWYNDHKKPSDKAWS
jgi:hypothetical protein